MIHVMKNGKFKSTNIQTAEDLISKYELDHLHEPEKLIKEHNKGNHVYCWISPYGTEIDQSKDMYWGLDPEQELADYYQSSEEI